MWTYVWKPAIFAVMAPVGLAACALPTSRMPPTAPVAMPAPMAAPAPAAPVMSPMAAPVAAPVPTLPPAPAFPAAGMTAQAPSFPAAMASAAMPAPVLPASDGPPPAAARGIAGLTERQPDLCGAKQQSSAIGSPGSVIPTLGLTRSYRIVEYRGIEPQDYVPDRMVFRLDASGNITNIDCG